MKITQLMYEKFLNVLEKKVCEKDFINTLEQVKMIDEKYYSEVILIQELKDIIKEYREKECLINVDVKKIQVILPGNPEIVFRLGIETVRNSVAMLINIEDFCVAQNTLLIDVINSAAKDCDFRAPLRLKNLLKDNEIIENSKKLDLTICIGNSNDYNVLSDKIINLKFYPYNILEVYSDSKELEDVKRGVYDYAIRNQFEIEIYDMDMDLDNVIEDMNKNGYGFCSVLFSKDKEKIKKFKQQIKSKYIIVNENPFKKLKFEFDLKG